jgi:exosortase
VATLSKSDSVLKAGAALLSVAAALVLMWPAFEHSVVVWRTVEEFSFGFLIPAVSVLLIWLHWSELRRAAGRGANAGLIVVAFGLAAYILAYRIDINAIGGVAVVVILWGGSVFLWGWQVGKILAFPIGFLAFGLALYRGLLGTVGFVMQGFTAAGAGALAEAAQLGVVRDGLVLRAEGFAFIVAEPCSGMSSLVSLLALAALWTHLANGSLPARAAIILSVLPLVVLANSVRVSLVLLIASWYGQDAALGFFHGASSLVLFGLALTGLLVISRVVGCKAPRFVS